MSIITVIVIVGAMLAIYYCGMIGYDLYIDNLSKVNKEEAKERAIDISGEAEDFSSIPVNQQNQSTDGKSRFDSMMQNGLKVETFSRIINSGEDEISKALGEVAYVLESAA